MNTPAQQYWVREYLGMNPECCEGMAIHVTHTKDVKEHCCTWCGMPAQYKRDVGTFQRKELQ